MRTHNFKATLKAAAQVASLLLFGAVAAFGQQVVNLTAAPTTTTLPTGATVPMWGYFCTPAAPAASTATCAALNPASVSANPAIPSTWSPVVITVPAGQFLQINLTNSLTFTPVGGAANNIPTSLTIVGQLGGGLGMGQGLVNPACPAGGVTCTPSPSHSGLVSDTVTWATVGAAPGFTPPPQLNRAQSFATEVAAGTTTALTFGSAANPLRPGTYLIESGTHPSIQGPMGLYGILVVTCPPSAAACTGLGAGAAGVGQAYPGVAATASTAAVPAVNYNADVPLVFSEIDPVQNVAVNAAVNTNGFSEIMVWSGQPGGCGNPSSPTYHQCLPPAVNYTPLYYLIDGVAFNKTNAAASRFSVTPNSAVAGQVLLRVVNAGSRMHVPAILGSQTTGFNGAGTSTTVNGFSIIAEDGTPLPGVPKVQNQVLMVPGKVYDLMINAPAACVPVAPATTCTNAALPIYDRELSLSANGTGHDGGMLAYISINGAAAGATLPAAPVLGPAIARHDDYAAVAPCAAAPCTPLNVYDPGKGVIANDSNVYGVSVLTPPATGTLVLNPNGTFIYTPAPGFTSDGFTYCANVAVTGVGAAATCTAPAGAPNTTVLTATVSLTAEGTTGTLTTPNRTYMANTSSYFALKSPGVLGTQYDTTTPGPSVPATDSAGFPLHVAMTAPNAPAPVPGLTLAADAEGGFTASVPVCPSTQALPGCPYTFTYHTQDSEGTVSGTYGTVTIYFPPTSNLQVTVLDGYDKTTAITDYRWIIEEDRTFYNDPACSTNTGAAAAGSPNGPSPTCQPSSATHGVPPILGVNFHTSYMPYVAIGCTGQLSCEGGQTMYDNGTPCVGGVPNTPPGCSLTAGTHIPAVCDIGDGVCRLDPTGTGFTAVLPSSVHLDPSKRYYISVLPGDAGNPFGSAYGGSPNCTSSGGVSTPGTQCGHGMGGSPIPAACKPTFTSTGTVTPCTAAFLPVTILSQPSPFPTAKLSIFVFQDDFPLNGEHDASGGNGIQVNTNNEPGLGGFAIQMWDAFGASGDFTGQMGFDMFNQPLGNSLAGTLDPSTGLDACPMSATPFSSRTGANDPTQNGITGMIVTCPEYESDGVIPSPLAGQAVVAGLMPGRWGVIAHPGADRIARGEEWLQTNTLDGQKAHDSFTRIGEPAYFQEFGPAGYHVSIGFANPAIINARKAGVCAGTDIFISGNCSPGNTLTGRIVGERLSRTPDERLYGSSSRDGFNWTQCFVSFGDTDGEDFAFTKCANDGTFTLTGLPDGEWRLTTFDQWNDQLVDGLSTPVRLGDSQNLCSGTGSSQHTCNMGDIATTQWQSNINTRTFIDDLNSGVGIDPTTGQPQAGLLLGNVAVRYRDGSLSNWLVTDATGTANFNETFPLFSWYTIESDTTRYKNTGIHVVYDVGGPADGSSSCGVTGYPPCGTSAIGHLLANTHEQVSLPGNLRIPGAIYCADADCTGQHMDTDTGGGPTAGAPAPSCTSAASGGVTCTGNISSGRIDPPSVGMEGWQGFTGQFNFVEFGKRRYAPATATTPAETGGIHGHVEYASTRPFDDPQMLVQTQWTPMVPNVTINLYQEGVAADRVTPTMRLVDTTKTSSFDDWAQGFHLAADGVTKIPNMNCPGQGGSTGPLADLFFFSLYNQPVYLDYYNNVLHGTAAATTPLPYNSQFKCYDGMHNWNQIQPAPYDGAYSFPSVTGADPTTGRAISNTTLLTNCHMQTAGEPWGCIPNPDTADHFRHGSAMLPSGKYVVEIVLPPGFELVKEEDKNILIGDNFIAPVTQQFGGLGNVFIMPDQAVVASTYGVGVNPLSPAANGYNANNPQNPTQSFGTSPQNQIVPSFIPEPVWPCVGEARIVPDYISLFPQTHQVSPFAGALRNLCDRKEVTLQDQMSASAKFFIYTSTHIASKFNGGITDDFTSEFDPFSPTFGEKFSPPDMPVSVKDWTGAEISRVYSDHWGMYNGMVASTWEVNPPNPTGYAPGMSGLCMNDPGPILDTNPASPTFNQQITDPLFAQGYSQFCYELPFMPGTTDYTDTPVIPTSAFAGVGYNNVDCYYPDATPAIREVDGDGLGPYVATASSTLTIYSLGDQMVPNYAYTGPAANVAPYNQKTVKRNYGFGAQGTVTIGGVTAHVNSWSPTTISVSVPNGVPPCPIQQQTQYGGSAAQCGELVITTGGASPKRSIDTVTVTIGGKAPTHVPASGKIQDAIDAARPGDLIIIDPTCITTATGATQACPTTGGAAGVTYTTAAHNEMLIMWKPVRLQGVAAATSIVNANTHPAGVTKMDDWRRRVVCLFGLGLNGSPINSAANANNGTVNNYDPTGTYSCTTGQWSDFTAYDENQATGAGAFNPQVDRLPLEATVGWSAGLNGNLAELLQEPALMGALEGAGVTVLSKGVNFPSDPFVTSLFAGFPTGTLLLQNVPGTAMVDHCSDAVNPFPSNYECNPSSIDAVGITNSSQGGGGIFVHGWAHNLQIANNRIYNNAATLSGGINLGQGEFAGAYTQGGGLLNAPPGSCLNEPELAAGTILPYCENVNVNIHNNYVSLNMSIGDELFSATPAGAGGVSICTGSDYYQFNYNWVCGNLSTGDGGGVGHLGFSYNGDIEHNTVIFNSSQNPTITANGGGMIIMGTPDADVVCNAANPTIDQDCVPKPLTQATPSDGVGPGLVINANLIMGNAAEAGSGGGIAFQATNGSDVISFPGAPEAWNTVTVTNNIIVDNVAGYDGGGVSLLDSLAVNIINNTIAYNNSTASAGPLFNTVGSPLSSTPPAGQVGSPCSSTSPNSCGTLTHPQPAGVVVEQNSAIFRANINALPVGTVVQCPPGHFQSGNGANGSCRVVSYPKLENNIIYHNSTYKISVGTAFNAAFQNHVITIVNGLNGGAVPNQTTTGQCLTTGAGAAQYWDLGVRGDANPGSHISIPGAGGSVTLHPSSSVLSSTAGGYGGSGNVTGNPNFLAFYCDGSRTPPEGISQGLNKAAAAGWAVPPGISDATVPNPIFNLTPAATVDEGNNWVNLRWGPLSLTNPTINSGAGTTGTGNYGSGPMLGNYGIGAGSSAMGRVSNPANYADAPAYDFYGTPRKSGNVGSLDAGAVELIPAGGGVPGSTQPEVLSLDPPAAGRGATNLDVTLSGSGFTGATVVSFDGGVTVNSFSIINDSTIIADVTVARTTTPGVKNVTVTGPGGTSGPASFRVTSASATISNPAPPLTAGGASNTVTKTGTITVRNTAPIGGANSGPLVMTAAPTITRTAGTGTFSITGGTCTAGTSLEPNATCTIVVQYVPPAAPAPPQATAHVTIAGTGLPVSPQNGPNFNAN